MKKQKKCKIVSKDKIGKPVAPKEIQESKEIQEKVYNGIYMIHCLETDRKYIGSSSNIERRLKTHKRELEAGSHNNRFMQKDYDIHGESSFQFVVIKKNLSKLLLTAYEKYYMYKHNSIVRYKGYNMIFPTTDHKTFKRVYLEMEESYNE